MDLSNLSGGKNSPALSFVDIKDKCFVNLIPQLDHVRGTNQRACSSHVDWHGQISDGNSLCFHSNKDDHALALVTITLAVAIQVPGSCHS